MNRAGGWAALTLLVATSSALAADPPVGHPPTAEPDILEAPPRQLFPSRDHEWWLRILTRTDWAPKPHMGVGLAMDWSFAWDSAQYLRTGPYVEGLGGSWADGRRGEIALGAGVIHRSSVYMDDLFDPHFVLRFGGVLGVYNVESGSVAGALRAAGGIGLRVARFALVELTYDRLWVLGEPFAENESHQPASRQTSGMTIGGGIDVCLFIDSCKRHEPEPTPIDRTDELYRVAGRVCKNKEQQRALCDAVDLALDAQAYHPLAGDDGIHAFLVGVRTEVKDEHVRGNIDVLLKKHKELCDARDHSKAWGRWAAQSDRELACPISYAPVAVELRRELGCDELITDM